MKLVYAILILLFACFTLQLSAQTDSSTIKPTQQRRYGFRDSLYAAKLNYTGNLMIAGGVGLAAAGSFLIYEGVQTYNTPASPSSTNPAADVMRNHNQGTGYIIAGSASFIGSAVLIALGAKNKIEFKRRRKLMSLQTGLLDSGHLGLALSF